jgi:hypothetical protein
MFNESIYAFHVYHVMNFLPHSSRRLGGVEENITLVSMEVDRYTKGREEGKNQIRN